MDIHRYLGSVCFSNGSIEDTSQNLLKRNTTKKKGEVAVTSAGEISALFHYVVPQTRYSQFQDHLEKDKSFKFIVSVNHQKPDK